LILLKPNGEVVERWVGEGHTSDIRKAVRALRKSMPKKKVAHEKIPVELERDKTSKGEFFYPTKLAFDESTKTLFVTDSSHHQIAAYTWNAETPALLKPAYRIGKRGEAGFKDGSASSARFRRPQGIAVRNGVLY